MTNNTSDVRFSHLLGYSGVGAIVVTPKNKLIIIEDTNNWTDRNGRQGAELIPFVERVKISLGIEQDLRTPPIARMERNLDGKGEHIEGVAIPAIQFPTWHICHKCGKLFHKSAYKDLPDSRCNNCHGTLELLRYVLVHPKGYIADVDWKFLAHRDAVEHNCEKRDNLFLDKNTGYLVCKDCGAKVKFSGKEEGLSFGRRNQQPWLYDCPAPEEDQRDGKAKIKKVNDISIYSAETVSALVIPPESRIDKDSVIANLYAHPEDITAIKNNLASAGNPLQQKRIWPHWAKQYQTQPTEIRSSYESIINGDYPPGASELQNVTLGKLEEDEYKAFLKKSFNPAEGEDFVIHRHETNQKYPVENLIKANRLKEIRVFKGFKRDFGEAIVPPDLDGKSGWLPAIEMWGEGIFFTLDEKTVVHWETNPNVQQLFKEMRQNFLNSNLVKPNPNSLSPRFILLHTLAHILIRQLEVLAGYPAASIRERIYSQVGEFPMAGILLYTTAPDKVGTLGGLAELSEPSKFYNLLENSLRQAQWCSSDPVCAEHELHGPHNLNRSACHACVLLPETSCDFGNVLLDRKFIIEFVKEFNHEE